MEIIFTSDKSKARWQTDSKKGKMQSIKNDDGGKYITIEGSKHYVNEYFVEKKKRRDLDDNELKIYHAYYETKTFWDNMFDDVAEDDYYHYRSKCTGMPKSFFEKEPID